MSHRMTAAFVEVESSTSRAFRDLAGGGVTDEERRAPVRLGRYWCAADKPPTDGFFAIKPVGRTTRVPKHAECETCGISIRELQAALTEAYAGRGPREETG